MICHDIRWSTILHDQSYARGLMLLNKVRFDDNVFAGKTVDSLFLQAQAEA